MLQLTIMIQNQLKRKVGNFKEQVTVWTFLKSLGIIFTTGLRIVINQRINKHNRKIKTKEYTRLLLIKMQLLTKYMIWPGIMETIP